jgi:hypothetical protein
MTFSGVAERFRQCTFCVSRFTAGLPPFNDIMLIRSHRSWIAYITLPLVDDSVLLHF